MSRFYQRMKFAWDYFVRGRQRISSSSKTPHGSHLPKLDVHLDPLVGEYIRTKIGTWWSDARLSGLDYSVRLISPGQQPTIEQMRGFEALVLRLPALAQASQLEDAPRDDGWGHRPPPFSIHTARVSSITMRGDGSYFVIFEVDAEDVYMLAPAFEISPDLNLTSAEWSV